jgi:SAM-dependent methyltransferase
MNCPVCFSQNIFSINTYTSKGYSFFHCTQCDVIFADPMIPGSKDWYEQHNFYEFRQQPKDNKPWYEQQFLFSRFSNEKKKILNIGCGYNQFLRQLKLKANDIVAVDLNANSVKFTRQIIGIDKAYVCEIMEFIREYQGEEFDCIIFFELLEHLSDPGMFLREIKRILKKDGIIVFSVPNRDRFAAHKHWADYPPHHLTRWNLHSIAINLAQKKFSLIESRISPICPEQIMYIFNIYFGTLKLEKILQSGKSNFMIKLLYGSLLKFRILFYTLLVLPCRLLIRAKGTYIFTIAKNNE